EQSSTFRLVFRLVPPSVKRKTFQTYTLIAPWIGHIIGSLVLVLVFVDAIANNWAVNDYCGNALQFRTPFAHIHIASELPNDFIFLWSRQGVLQHVICGSVDDVVGRLRCGLP
ncbi:hypothetical protein DYB28_015511, partial [Aphanomyces astaci]